MLTQEQLIIKLLWEERLNAEERKILDKNSLTIPFIAKAIERHLAEVIFLPNNAIKFRSPRVEGACLEFIQKKYVLPFVNFEFTRQKYIIHELGFHGEERKTAYRKLLPALKYYMNCISDYRNNSIDGLKISK